MTLKELKKACPQETEFLLRWGGADAPRYANLNIESIFDKVPEYVKDGKVISGTEGLEAFLKVTYIRAVSNDLLEVWIVDSPLCGYVDAARKETAEVSGEDPVFEARKNIFAAKDIIRRADRNIRTSILLIAVSAVTVVLVFLAGFQRR